MSTSYFDKEYYDDQCSVRGKVVYLSKVTKEFALQEEKRKKDEVEKKKSEERKKKRKELEQGIFETVSVDEVFPSDEIIHDSSIDQDKDETYVLLSPQSSSTSDKQTIVTRISAERSK